MPVENERVTATHAEATNRPAFAVPPPQPPTVAVPKRKSAARPRTKSLVPVVATSLHTAPPPVKTQAITPVAQPPKKRAKKKKRRSAYRDFLRSAKHVKKAHTEDGDRLKKQLLAGRSVPPKMSDRL